MMHVFPSFKLFLAAGLLTAAFSNTAHADIELTFGTYSSEKPTAVVKQLHPILKVLEQDLSASLGERVVIRTQVVRGYEQGVALITEGKVDFARLGPASYVIAKKTNPSLSIIALEKKSGRKVFEGIIAVHQSSNIRSLQDLRGVNFGFGNERSTLGRYFAQLYLADAGIHAHDLKSYKYLGRHDKVGRAVGSRLVDAGALEETTFQKLVDEGVPIRAIARMPNATRPWVAKAGCDERIRNALQNAMIGLKESQDVDNFRFEGFLRGDDTDYAMTRRAIQENDRFFARR